MMGAWGHLSFTAPLALLALALLPVIWWVLRAMPPPPRRAVFPPLRLLAGLQSTAQTPDATPLWLRLLRLLIVAAGVSALAGPVWSPKGVQTDNAGPLILIVDDGWASAPLWATLQTSGARMLASAGGRADGAAVIFSARPEQSQTRFSSPAAARRILRSHNVAPFAPTRKEVLAHIAALVKQSGDTSPRIIWLCDGIDHGGAADFMKALAGYGDVRLVLPQGEQSALLMQAPKASTSGLEVTLLRTPSPAARPVQVVALDKDGGIIYAQEANFAPGKTSARITMVLPLALRNRMVLLTTATAQSAGSTWVFDGRWARPLVGLIAPRSGGDSQPLLSGLFYLEKALSPHAQVVRAPLADLLQRQPAVLVLTDAARPPPAQWQDLVDFVEQGGLLIRFAGPHLAANNDTLLPVKLRRGGRLLDGSFGWDTPQGLADFAPHSPFYGLRRSDNINVRREVLALPQSAAPERVWARLDDGTPLVSSARMGKGRIVLFHVTASPDWSDLPLAGLFSTMLERVLIFAPGQAARADDDRAQNWQLIQKLDAKGRVRKPDGAPVSLPGATDLDKLTASAATPPGLYTRGARSGALNIGAGQKALLALPPPPMGMRVQTNMGAAPAALAGPLAVLAFVLFITDTLLSLWFAGLLRWSGFGRRFGAGLLFLPALVLVFGTPSPGQADEAEAARALALQRAGVTRFGYILSGDGRVDRMSKAGLFGLSQTLRARTTVEPEEPVALDPERDDFAVFSLIYWPILNDPDLSPKAIETISRYLKNGGMLVIDTQDAGLRATIVGGVDPALKAVFAQIDLPRLRPIPADHVLTRSYYLLRSFPGRTVQARVWVESAGRGASLDGVSGVIVGANDWAAAWAVDKEGNPLAALSDDMRNQREMARRFGVNLVMYALTGNYKADQVHVPAILKRLGTP